MNTGQDTVSPSVAIECEFTDYPDELIIDDSNKISPSKEYLLNTNGNIHLKREYTGKTLTSKTYLVANHPYQESIKDLLELDISKLKQRAKDMNVNLSNINQTIKSEIRHAIWKRANAQDFLKIREIPIDKSNTKGEFKSIETKLEEHMPIFALFKSDRPNLDQDAEAQDPLKLAVKEIIKAQQQELGHVESKIRSELQGIANQTVEKIREIDPEIAKKLTPNISDPAWDKAFKISLTSEEQIPVNKRGSGIRRLILLSFFRVKAEQKAEGKDVIYAIEEPETSQHPNNQKMLLDTFEELANRSDCQVLVTTHTPMLASRISEESLRYVKKDNSESKVINRLDDRYKKEVTDSLGVLPNNKVKLFLLVEGKNDINFLGNISKLFQIDIPVREKQGHLIFIPMGGSNLQLWANRLEELNTPEIRIYDRDDKKTRTDDDQNEKIFRTSKREMENYIHPEAIVEAYEAQKIKITVDKSEIDAETDVPELIAEKVHKAANNNEKEWSALVDRKKKQKADRGKENPE